MHAMKRRVAAASASKETKLHAARIATMFVSHTQNLAAATKGGGSGTLSGWGNGGEPSAEGSSAAMVTRNSMAVDDIENANPLDSVRESVDDYEEGSTLLKNGDHSGQPPSNHRPGPAAAAHFTARADDPPKKAQPLMLPIPCARACVHCVLCVCVCVYCAVVCRSCAVDRWSGLPFAF